MPDEGLAAAPAAIEFTSLRSDWYAGDAMHRLLRRAGREDKGAVVLSGFPRQWLPVFEWVGAAWRGSCEPERYIPLVSGRTEGEVMADVARAREAGQLRLLAEVVASADPLVAEVLPRLQARADLAGGEAEERARILLPNWHSYGRDEVKVFERDLQGFRPSHPDVIFLPCGRARPYQRSPTHRRLMRELKGRGVNPACHDLIVITSLGPVPEAMWEHPTVMRYDTGVRDVYRMLVLFRRMLRGFRYGVAWDCLRLAPYRDLIGMLRREGYVGEVRPVRVGADKPVAAYRP